jgi:hypothetical protein
MRVRIAGMTASKVLALFTQTANAGPVGTTSETNLISTGIGTATLAANLLTVGKHIRIRLSGHYSTNNIARTLTLRGKIGSTTIDTAAPSTTAQAAGRNFIFDWTITCYSTGASGTVWSRGNLQLHDTTAQFDITSVITVDTTAAQVLQLSAEFSGAPASSTYMTCTECTIEMLN